jgi:hypothetical protein
MILKCLAHDSSCMCVECVYKHDMYAYGISIKFIDIYLCHILHRLPLCANPRSHSRGSPETNHLWIFFGPRPTSRRKGSRSLFLSFSLSSFLSLFLSFSLCVSFVERLKILIGFWAIYTKWRLLQVTWKGISFTHTQEKEYCGWKAKTRKR